MAENENKTDSKELEKGLLNYQSNKEVAGGEVSPDLDEEILREEVILREEDIFREEEEIVREEEIFRETKVEEAEKKA